MLFFFFNDTATTEIYTLSLHDALPIYDRLLQPIERLEGREVVLKAPALTLCFRPLFSKPDNIAPGREIAACARSEEHTSELQSRQYLVCRLLLEKKKKIIHQPYMYMLL